MSRSVYVFLLAHFYPCFVVLHLILGGWSRVSQLIFNIVPIAVFGGLFQLWKTTSDTELSVLEKISLGYLIMMIVLIYAYYNICVISSSTWIKQHNTQFTIFIAVTGLYYIYELGYKNAKR